jgi:multidrug resistance efflux pump
VLFTIDQPRYQKALEEAELGLTLQSALTPLADWMREYGDRLKR